MKVPDWIKSIFYWILNLLIWGLLNILLGSLPFFQTLFENGKGSPFQIGILCFCFTIVSSGLYMTLVDLSKGEKSGFAKAGYSLELQFFQIILQKT